MKKTIKAELKGTEVYSMLAGSLTEVSSRLLELQSKHPDKQLEIEDWSCLGDIDLRVVYPRIETDEEYNTRVQIEETQTKNFDCEINKSHQNLKELITIKENITAKQPKIVRIGDSRYNTPWAFGQSLSRYSGSWSWEKDSNSNKQL